MLVAARFLTDATEPHSQRVTDVSWRDAACCGVQFGHSAAAYHVRPYWTVVAARIREASIPASRSCHQTRTIISRHCVRPIAQRSRKTGDLSRSRPQSDPAFWPLEAILIAVGLAGRRPPCGRAGQYSRSSISS
jgi:hypothetical protein